MVYGIPIQILDEIKSSKEWERAEKFEGTLTSIMVTISLVLGGVLLVFGLLTTNLDSAGLVTVLFVSIITMTLSFIFPMVLIQFECYGSFFGNDHDSRMKNYLSFNGKWDKLAEVAYRNAGLSKPKPYNDPSIGRIIIPIGVIGLYCVALLVGVSLGGSVYGSNFMADPSNNITVSEPGFVMSVGPDSYSATQIGQTLPLTIITVASKQIDNGHYYIIDQSGVAYEAGDLADYNALCIGSSYGITAGTNYRITEIVGEIMSATPVGEGGDLNG
ncbi:MAG: hypothetical protein WC343_13535 [Bacilli bacterium]|jgi:hypothetical protein